MTWKGTQIKTDSATLSNEGGVNKLNITDSNQTQMFSDTIKELKILNLHMSLITDLNITKVEIV